MKIKKWPFGLKFIATWVLLETIVGTCQLIYWYRTGHVFSSRYNLQTTYVTLAVVFSAFSVAYLVTANRIKFVISTLILAFVHLFVCLHYAFKELNFLAYIHDASIRLSEFKDMLNEPYFYVGYIYIISMIIVAKYLFKKELLFKFEFKDDEKISELEASEEEGAS